MWDRSILHHDSIGITTPVWSENLLNKRVYVWVLLTSRSTSVCWQARSFVLTCDLRRESSLVVSRLNVKMPTLRAFLSRLVSCDEHSSLKLCVRDIYFRLTFVIVFKSVAAMTLIGFWSRLYGMLYPVLKGLFFFLRERVILVRMVFMPRVV